MHYHIAENPDFQGARNPQWCADRIFCVMPEVSRDELARSTPDCLYKYGLLVVKPSGDETVEALVNNNGKRREFTPRQLVDFLTTCSKKGDSVSIDGKVASSYIGGIIEDKLASLFGEDGYTIASARAPDSDYVRSLNLSPKARATQ